MKLSPVAFALAASPAVASVLNTHYLQAPLNEHHHQQPHNDNGLWDSVLPSKDIISSILEDSVDYLTSTFDNVKHAVEDLQEEFHASISEIAKGGPGGHDYPDHTIYQLISKCNYTTKFAKLVDEHPSVIKLLNSTKANYTLFVPIDEAFDDIPDDHKKPSKEFIEEVLLYHVGLGKYPARRILYTHTLPSALDEKMLGGESQRLRTSVGLTGVRVNFYSRVVAADIGAQNGVIHAVRSILAPPPSIGRIISLFPAQFSTLLLAYEKTEFVKFIHNVNMVGSTVFAPSNSAFAWLGPKANAFLFNTETGLKYLKALLKYHIAPNATLYSDAFYNEAGKADAHGIKREHFDLKTLLGDVNVGVDIASLGGFRSMRVNGFSHVTIQDGIGKNGVIQVVDHVLIPPKKYRDAYDSTFGDVEIEDLKERLGPYLEHSKEEPSEL